MYQVSKNCPVTVDDLANASSILGPHNRDRLKGAATRRKPNSGVGVEYRVKIPRDWYKLNKCVTLTAVVMFVCVLPLFATLSGKIKLVTAQYMPTKKAGQLAKSLRKIVKLYAKGGFIVRLVLMPLHFTYLVN